MKPWTAVLFAFAIAAAWAGGSSRTTAAMLPGGSAEDTALRDAALFLDIESVKTALKKGANCNSPSSTKRPITPLSAVMMGSLSSWRTNATELGVKNQTALKLSQGGMSDQEITKYLAIEITKTLFATGAKLGPYDREILFYPISAGNVELVRLLLDHGASATGDLEGFTPTELAKKYDQEAIYKLLVSRGGIPVDSSASAQIALVQAAGSSGLGRDEEVIANMERAIKLGANINGAGPDNRTALIAAVREPIYIRAQVDSIEWLLDHGADPNQKSESGFQGLEGLALHIFVAMNKSTLAGNAVSRFSDAKPLAEVTLARLLKAGAKVSGMDSQNCTPLHIAAKFDNVRAAEILIKEGAKVMPKDKEGKTPLDYAESAAMIKLLKENGATER